MMIEQLAYIALLSAPEIASGATTLAGKMVEGVGRRLASGMYEEVRRKLALDTGRLGQSLFGAVTGQVSGVVDGLQDSASKILKEALQGEGATLASAEELRILRKLAAEAEEGQNLTAVLAELRQFYSAQTNTPQG